MTAPSFRPPSNFGAPKQKMGSEEKSTLGCLAVILAPGILIVAVVVISVIVGAQNGGSPTAPNRFEAIRYCEDAVRDDLRSPATAEFDSDSTDTNPYRVTGTVDAENGFGATIRNSFQCTVEIAGDSFNVTVDRLG